jgi:hypothetical protein
MHYSVLSKPGIGEQEPVNLKIKLVSFWQIANRSNNFLKA